MQGKNGKTGTVGETKCRTRRQPMIFKTFIIGMVLVGITIILTELHRYMVYSEELEREEENAR